MEDRCDPSMGITVRDETWSGRPFAELEVAAAGIVPFGAGLVE